MAKLKIKDMPIISLIVIYVLFILLIVISSQLLKSMQGRNVEIIFLIACAAFLIIFVAIMRGYRRSVSKKGWNCIDCDENWNKKFSSHDIKCPKCGSKNIRFVE